MSWSLKNIILVFLVLVSFHKVYFFDFGIFSMVSPEGLLHLPAGASVTIMVTRRVTIMRFAHACCCFTTFGPWFPPKGCFIYPQGHQWQSWSPAGWQSCALRVHALLLFYDLWSFPLKTTACIKNKVETKKKILFFLSQSIGFIKTYGF